MIQFLVFVDKRFFAKKEPISQIGLQEDIKKFLKLLFTNSNQFKKGF
jgi:hypothetical protein